MQIKRKKENIPAISFIVPFPQICKYHEDKKDYNSWNEMLYKPTSILFCNIDNKHLYNWWNFAAIIDFKWETFGKSRYYLILASYTIFYICYALASTLDQKFIPDLYRHILFMFSNSFGIMHLSFEIRQCLWYKKIYFNDPWNLFGK